ncbi:MAG: alginate export family protein [Verrucomicrobiaceae bacterium]|nr:alginate export family protein [Verrucomicrobiaceae bacterium]
MKSLRPIIALLLVASSPAFAGDAASSAKAPATPPPPPPANPLSFFDGKLTFDFEEKMRFEARENNFDFNSGVDSLTDDAWLLQRARLGALFKPTPWLSFYAQGQDAREFDSDRPNIIGELGAEGDDTFDLLEGWVMLGQQLDGWSFKAGRQKLSYGDQRLVGPLEWLNPSRTFDAAKLRYAGKKYSFDLFTSSVVTFEDGVFNQSDFYNDSPRDQMFSGAYLATQFVPFNTTTDFYVFHLDQNAPTGNQSFFTLGTLWKGDPKKLNGFYYNTEMALQFGEVADKDLFAFAGHWKLGYQFQDAWKTNFGVQYNYGSGDDNPTDGDVGTFQNLFPTNHLFYGFMDTTGWINMHNPQINLSIQPTEKIKITLDYHLYWNDTSNDAWYRVNGITKVRENGAGADTFRGSEIDVTVAYKHSKNLSFLFGYSHYFAGDYLSDTGASDDADFAYAQVQVNF